MAKSTARLFIVLPQQVAKLPDHHMAGSLVSPTRRWQVTDLLHELLHRSAFLSRGVHLSQQPNRRAQSSPTPGGAPSIKHPPMPK